MNSLPTILSILSVLIVVSGSARANPADPAPHAAPHAAPHEVVSEMERIVAAARTASATVVAFRSAREHWAHATGPRHPGGALATVDDPFRIASVSKAFVAAAAHRLVEQGVLALDSPIGPLLSGTSREMLDRAGYDLQRIRLVDLMTHQSGLRDYATSQTYMRQVFTNPQRQWTRTEQLAIAMGLGRPMFVAGKRTRYSDTGYILLGEIVERASGQPLGQAVPALLGFPAIGLRRTSWEQPAAGGGSGLPADAIHAFQGRLDTAAMDPSFDLFGGGGMISSAPELLDAMAAVVSGRAFERPDTVARLRQAVSPADRGGDERTAGLEQLYYDDFICFGHKGHWGTMAVWCPDQDAGFVFSVNSASGAGYRLAARIHALLARRLIADK